MPIPIAKEQEQFRAPTAATSSGNAGKVLPVNTGMTEATENITKAAFTVNDVLAKLRISNEQAKATNDFLAYKKQMNDLLYSNELDENGNPIGFIYKKGENAYNSLKEYDAKASALYQNFTKKLSNYLPVASEAAFKSANDYNESFRSMLMRHSSEQNLAFKKDAVVNYAADKKASVAQDLIAALSKEGKIDDKLINFTDMSLTDMDSMIMEYFVNTAGMPTAGIQMSKKENADLLKIILSQAAVELYDKDHMFGGYQHCQALLDKLKQDSVEGKGLLPTEKVFEVGRNFTLDQFETAFRHPNFDEDVFFKKLDDSQWLYPVDKIKYTLEYKERLKKASSTGYGNNIEAQTNFLHYVSRNSGGYQRGDLGYLHTFLPELAHGAYDITKASSVNPKTLEPYKDEEGNIKNTYSIVFTDKKLMDLYNSDSMTDSGRELIKTFALRYAGYVYGPDDITWMPPSEKEITTLLNEADSFNREGAEGNEANPIRTAQLKNAINSAGQLAKNSSPQVDIYKNKDNETIQDAYISDNQYVQNIKNFMGLFSDMQNGRDDLDSKAFVNLYNAYLDNISDIDASQMENGRVAIHKGFIGNFLGIPEYLRKNKVWREKVSAYYQTERAKNRNSLINLLSIGGGIGGDYLYFDEYDPEKASEGSVKDKQVAYNERAEQVKRFEKQASRGEVLFQNRSLLNRSLDISKQIAEAGGIGLLTGYATVDEKGIQNTADKYAMTRFSGYLSLKDWNKIDISFYAKLFTENGWDINKFSRYISNIEEHWPQYVNEYNQHVADYIFKTKRNELEVSTDGGRNWSKTTDPQPYADRHLYSEFGTVKHVSLAPVKYDKPVTEKSPEEFQSYLSSYGDITTSPATINEEKSYISGTNKNTFLNLQEKREKEAAEFLEQLNKASMYSSRGRKK